MTDKHNSTHEALVVQIETINKHPNANALEIVKIFEYECITRIGEFKIGDKGIYICPDSLVKVSRPEFAFLADPSRPEKQQIRIKAKKLRGVYSQGLLIPVPEGIIGNVGDDVAAQLEIEHWTTPEPTCTNADTASPPRLKDSSRAPIYEIDSIYKYVKCFVPGEEVIGNLKINGTNARFVYSDLDDAFFLGTHYRFVKHDHINVWSKAVDQNPWIEEWCQANPQVIVYAEVYGQVKNFKYKKQPGQYGIAVFDLMKDGKYLDHDAARELGKGLIFAPTVYRGPFDFELLKNMTNELKNVWNDGPCEEGIVITTPVSRWDPKLQDRLKLKLVSATYLAKE